MFWYDWLYCEKLSYFTLKVKSSPALMRKVEKSTTDKHYDSILNHTVIFLDYDFISSLLNSCSSLIGCLWVIHMAVNLCTNLCKIFQAAYEKADGAFPWEPQEAVYAFSSGGEMTSPLTRALPHHPQHRNESPDS